jgi:hypothetical protein
LAGLDPKSRENYVCHSPLVCWLLAPNRVGSLYDCYRLDGWFRCLFVHSIVCDVDASAAAPAASAAPAEGELGGLDWKIAGIIRLFLW